MMTVCEDTFLLRSCPSVRAGGESTAVPPLVDNANGDHGGDNCQARRDRHRRPVSVGKSRGGAGPALGAGGSDGVRIVIRNGMSRDRSDLLVAT
jgi:hypothetical protein